MPDELSTLLDDYNANTVREMAEANDIATVGENGKKLSKDKLLPKMKAEFFTEERVLASYRHLSKAEQAVVNRLLLRGGQVPKRVFRRELIRAGLAITAPETKTPARGYYRSEVPYDTGYIGNPSRTESTIFEDVIARLTYRGLVFSQGSDTNTAGNSYKLRFHPATMLYIPQAIQAILPTPTPVDDSLPELQPVEIFTADPTLFLRDLYLYWDFARRNDVRFISSGFVGKRDLKAINETLLTPDPLLEESRREDQMRRLYLLRQLLQALGLVRVDPNSLQPSHKSALDIPAFWQKSQVEQVRKVFEKWQKFNNVQDLQGDALRQYQANFSGARRLILDTLKSLPSNRWLDADEFLEEIQSKNINFLFPERSLVENSSNRSYYYSSSYFYGQPQTLLANFDKLEKGMVEAYLSGLPFQLGLIELGQLDTPASTDRQWSTFRLTPLGLHLFKNAELPPSTEHTGKLLVQPNFQVMAIGPVSLATLAKLDLFAIREQADRGAFQYRLSRESVYEAQQIGLSVAEITEILLREAGQDDLPQNVERSLTEWGSHHERIVFRQGVSLLQTANADLLKRLLSDSDTAKLLARPVADDVALVSAKDQSELIDTLMDQSLLPAVSGADPQAADRSVFVQNDGTIEPIHAVPSLHLRGRLAALAETDDEGRWRLTSASVRRAGGSKRKVTQILEELDKLHRGQLPEAVVSTVKKWGGYYGQAAAQTVTLLEFSDREIMNELLKSPQLKKILTPFPTKDRALVIVPADQLAQVETVLSDLGITLQEGLLSG